MKYVRKLAACLVVWTLWAAVPGNATVTWASAPLPAVATAPSSAQAADAKELRAKAFKELLAGHFPSGLALLEQVDKLQPHRATARARALTGGYLKARAKNDAERRAETAAAVARVRLARLAEQHRPVLVERKIDEKLFERTQAIAEAVFEANKQLRGNGTSRPKQARKAAREGLERAAKELTSAEELPGAGHGEWGRAYRESARAMRRHLAGYAKLWEAANLPQDRPALKDAAEKVQNDLMDLGVLVSLDPLVAALGHAREAEELARDQAGFLRRGWVRQLIGDAERRGAALIQQGKWGDALTIYGHAGLSDLDSDNVAYQDTVKRISQHVRVISLYAGGHDETDWAGPGAKTPFKLGATIVTPLPSTLPSLKTPPGSQPGPTQPAAPAEVPRWREMIGGIDTRMVRNAISNIDYHYVEAPDYRKIGRAALKAVKVLVETPQAAAAFPSLKDDPRRAAFLKRLDEQIAQLDGLPNVGHLDVTLALDRLLDLNADTLALPPEVINMEFAEGLTGELDRFTMVIWPYEMEDFEKRTMGSFYGIGIQIRKDHGKPIEVVTPLPDTPAFRARIQAGDLILRVDGRHTKTMAINKAVRLITGPRLTTVTLTIKRYGVPSAFNVAIVRDKIEIQTVKGWRRLPDGKWNHFVDPGAGIAYVRITQFTSSTVDELRAVLRELGKAEVRGLILDLRFNPGGLLNGAVEVADEFLSRGLIVRTKGRNVRRAERSATAVGEYQEGKLVVLVNRISASAAEIVSGALKDWGRALVVGERTYGKASVQRLIPLRPKRARLKLTTAYYYLPSGMPLHRTNGAKQWGVDPHTTVPVTTRQMNRWAEIRRETDLLKAVDEDVLSTLLAQQLRADLQLQTALLLVRLQLLSQAT